MKEVSLSRMRWKFFLLGFFKIPMIHCVRPKIVRCNDNEMLIRIPFRRRTKNHLNSMYFGALNIGTDLAAGLFVYYLSDSIGKKVGLSFKIAKGNFLKRPESHVVFSCVKGEYIREKMEEALHSNSRVNFTLPVEAKNTIGEVVAFFDMEVSIRIS